MSDADVVADAAGSAAGTDARGRRAGGGRGGRYRGAGNPHRTHAHTPNTPRFEGREPLLKNAIFDLHPFGDDNAKFAGSLKEVLIHIASVNHSYTAELVGFCT